MIKKRKKLVLVAAAVLVLVLAGGVYKVVFAKAAAAPVRKVDGTVVPLTKEFLVNLADGHYAKVSVALVMEEGSVPAGEGVVLEQDAVVRSVVTDELTGLPGSELVSRQGREALRKRLLKALHKSTDEHVEDVLFTDITVQ